MEEHETGQEPQAQAQSAKVGKIRFVRVKNEDSAPQGRRHSLDDPRVMALLEAAYRIGCTHEEAAMTAVMSPDTIESWMSRGVKLELYANGEPTGQIVTYAEMVNLWKCHMTIQAKRKIYRAVVDESTGTHDAWRVLERRQPTEWGLRAGTAPLTMKAWAGLIRCLATSS